MLPVPPHLVSHLLHTDGPRSLARALNTRAAEAARRGGDNPACARALFDLGSADALTQAAELYSSLGDRAGQARALADPGHARWMHGDYAGAEECHQLALSIFTALGDRDGQARLLTDRGEVRRMTGDYRGALDDQRRALALFRELGVRWGQGRVLTMLGEVRYLTGDYAGAADDLDQARVVFEEIGSDFGIAQVLVYRADVRAAQGDLAGGIQDIERAREMFRERNPERQRPWAWPLGHLAALIAQTGETASALTLYRETAELAREQHQRDDEAIALEGIGECLISLESGADTSEAERYLAQSLAIYREIGMRPDAERVTARLAELRGQRAAHT